MPKRSSTDINQIAASIVAQSTGQALPTVQTPRQAGAAPIQTPASAKNPAAVALGRLGGLKGGKARAETLSPSRRKEIAKSAALKRWAAK
jgi:hypothetical protein